MGKLKMEGEDRPVHPPHLFISQLLRWIERGSRFIEVESGHTQKVPPTTATSPCDYSAVQQNFRGGIRLRVKKEKLRCEDSTSQMQKVE